MGEYVKMPQQGHSCFPKAAKLLSQTGGFGLSSQDNANGFIFARTGKFMKRFFKAAWYSTLFTSATLLTVGFNSVSVIAQTLYNPLPLSSGEEITDSLSEQDIPTGDGGFSRDYKVNLQDGDQVAIDLISDLGVRESRRHELRCCPGAARWRPAQLRHRGRP
ncbi:MAG: hypothetical protein F6K03_09965 [Kamptonema sp. SIO4C4]|nr:hypothetical protein [Kamptonema sp. SIO4C4]